MGKTTKILVIGAGGQLGSELTQGLWERYGKGNIVATDLKPNDIITQGDFEILDALDQEAVSNLIKKRGITQIYHLAAILSAKGEKNPKLAWRLNMDSLMQVLDIALENKIEKIYWPSSIAVFGPTTPKDNTPQHTITEPATVYGITKLAGERLCEWYYNNHGLDVRSLRYPGLIGYKSEAGGGTTDYAVDIYFKAIREKKFTCYLNEDTYLPMMYMADAVKATLDLMDAPPDKVKVRSSYNISSMSFCPKEIANTIQQHIPEFKINYKPDFRQQIAASWPNSIDDVVAREDWGWQPDYPLERMTKEIITHLREKETVHK